MKFYFCETCGERLTEHDIDEGKARNKKLRGVYCKACAENVLTLDTLPISDEEAKEILANKDASPSAPAPDVSVGELKRRKGRRTSAQVRLPAHASARGERAGKIRTAPASSGGNLPLMLGIGIAVTFLLGAVVMFSGGKPRANTRAEAKKSAKAEKKKEKVDNSTAKLPDANRATTPAPVPAPTEVTPPVTTSTTTATEPVAPVPTPPVTGQARFDLIESFLRQKSFRRAMRLLDEAVKEMNADAEAQDEQKNKADDLRKRITAGSQARLDELIRDAQARAAAGELTELNSPFTPNVLSMLLPEHEKMALDAWAKLKASGAVQKTLAWSSHNHFIKEGKLFLRGSEVLPDLPVNGLSVGKMAGLKKQPKYFNRFSTEPHPEAWSRSSCYWSYKGQSIPFMAISNFKRGGDAIEKNAPEPRGGAEILLQPPPGGNRFHSMLVCEAPFKGRYAIVNLAYRLITPGSDGAWMSVLVGNHGQRKIEGLPSQNTECSWVFGPPSIDLGTLERGEKVFLVASRARGGRCDVTAFSWTFKVLEKLGDAAPDSKPGTPASSQPKKVDPVSAKLGTYLARFDLAVLKKDLPKALAVADEAAKDPGLKAAAEAVAALKRVGDELVKGDDSKKKALAALTDGKPRTLLTKNGKVTGIVREVKGETLRLKVEGRINKQVIEYVKDYKLADLTPAGRAKLLGEKTPSTPDGWIAQALLSLLAGDEKDAKDALDKAGKHPLAPYYRDRVDAQRGESREGDAKRFWEEQLAPHLRSKKLGKSAARTAQKRLKTFREQHGETAFAASVAKQAKELGKAIMRALGRPKELTLDLGGGVKMAFAYVPPGVFMMGDPGELQAKNHQRSKPQHKVTLTKGFYLGKYEVTQAQYERITGKNTSPEKGPDLPAHHVSWNDCQAFCKKLSEKAGARIRLPTEAEWEHACRAGTKTKFWFGDSEADIEKYGWALENSGGKIHPVGQKKPNPFGLYDMHGNVWEFCEDWYGKYDTADLVDPKGPKTGDRRLMRGGSYDYAAIRGRSANRELDAFPDRRHAIYGFRVAMDF